jgi:hypothetical protein
MQETDDETFRRALEKVRWWPRSLLSLLYAALYGILVSDMGLNGSLIVCLRWPSVFDSILGNLSG